MQQQEQVEAVLELTLGRLRIDPANPAAAIVDSKIGAPQARELNWQLEVALKATYRIRGRDSGHFWSLKPFKFKPTQLSESITYDVDVSALDFDEVESWATHRATVRRQRPSASSMAAQSDLRCLSTRSLTSSTRRPLWQLFRN